MLPTPETKMSKQKVSKKDTNWPTVPLVETHFPHFPRNSSISSECTSVNGFLLVSLVEKLYESQFPVKYINFREEDNALKCTKFPLFISICSEPDNGNTHLLFNLF